MGMNKYTGTVVLCMVILFMVSFAFANINVPKLLEHFQCDLQYLGTKYKVIKPQSTNPSPKIMRHFNYSEPFAGEGGVNVEKCIKECMTDKYCNIVEIGVKDCYLYNQSNKILENAPECVTSKCNPLYAKYGSKLRYTKL